MADAKPTGLRRPHQALFVKSANTSTASRTNVRDDRETPLYVGGMARVITLI